MAKRWRQDQDRNGNAARRKLEFDVVQDQIKRRKAEFMRRVTSRLEASGECMVYCGTRDHKGYARLNFRFRGQHVSIGAHRLFLILKLGRPIKIGFEAGHLPECGHRACVKHLREEHYTSNAARAT